MNLTSFLLTNCAFKVLILILNIIIDVDTIGKKKIINQAIIKKKLIRNKNTIKIYNKKTYKGYKKQMR